MKPHKYEKSDTLRAFIALELSQEIKQAIADYVAPLRALDKGVSWTKAENVHLTLKFLGDTAQAQIENVKAALREICAGFAPFAAEISGAGVFPNEHRPRVLWIGMKESSGKLVECAQRIENECRRLGFAKEERSFSPHLTIGRVKIGKAENVVKALRESPFPARQIVFEECTLMRSELHPRGSIYTALETVAFGVS
jgi:2'-5' RNA ligase